MPSFLKKAVLLILLALPVPFAYLTWVEFERDRIQRNGELVSVQVLENRTLFDQGKEDVPVTIKVMMKGRTMSLEVPPRDRHLYPLNGPVDARYSPVSDELVNTTTNYGYEAMKYFFAALGISALIIWNIIRALILPAGSPGRVMRS